ncbi:MAG: DUF4301 family protein [Crocinitomicaceae bacterium]|nr:DUF4301 family protein [Crocinitomicaceae bacterium]
MENVRVEANNIEIQRDKVFGNQPDLKLISPCKIGDGVITSDDDYRELLMDKFDTSNPKTTFFIPASGSGSRMFQFLFDFLETPNDENTSQVERFLNHIEDFAFFQKLPIDVRKKIKAQDINLDEFVRFLLTDIGMGFGDLPKGLIPFHKNGPFVLNPYQEQMLQGVMVKEENASFHYTIKESFEDKIREGLIGLKEFIGQEVDLSFSYQNPETDAIAFDSEQNPVLLDNGDILTRPSGHGALLENLNTIQSDLIFIKNIDNIQHYAKSAESNDTWKYLGGMALWFQEKINKLIKSPSLEELIKLNTRFQFLNSQEIETLTDEEIPNLLNRPFRICGMVRNEGQPGGGPFWVEEEGRISKQIVEKSQIKMKGQQYRLMVQSTHFNPVVIVAVNKDVNGKPFDLMTFADESKYFVVNKKFKGKDIFFSELPGLWNGSMAHWNSIFVEIPSASFSPVKTVLDLLGTSHKEL